jgi:UDP-sulfoquinovose synthase
MGHPLTVYGGGEQKRSYLPIGDSLDCLTLALEHPPTKGEYRVFNQFDQFSSMRELALLVQRAGTGLGLEFAIAHYENPRLEVENHYYNPARDHLTALGYQPRNNPLEIIKTMLEQLQPWKDRIAERQSILIPDIQWDGSRKTALELDLRGITS